MPRKKERGFLNKLMIVVVLAIVTIAVLNLVRVGAPPTVRIDSALPGIGPRTPIQVVVETEGRGLTDVSVAFLQGERDVVLFEEQHVPRPFWAFWGPRRTSTTIDLEVGRETVEKLREGEATIRVTAGRAPTWIRHPDPVVVEKMLQVKLRPPQLHVLSSATYVNQGGAEAVVYRVGDSSVRDGVQAGTWWFPGSPLPGGGPTDRFALFAAPYDLDDDSEIRLIAEDDVGNRVELAFIDRFTPKPVRQDQIRLSDGFFEKVVPAIMAASPELDDRGGLLENYLQINGELRVRNGRTLRELAERSASEFLWSERFVQMPNSKVMSTFADRRTYLYDGRPVDRQDHLGFDLASTRQAEVPAANRGIVVLARNFGIYGNAVVIDHGYGLMSLYGHLSSIDVTEGQSVERGQIIGRTGDTGLAGGDHLHFTMLLQGLAVNPMEWWDAHWIEDRLDAKLGRALPFGN